MAKTSRLSRGRGLVELSDDHGPCLGADLLRVSGLRKLAEGAIEPQAEGAGDGHAAADADMDADAGHRASGLRGQ